MRDLPSIPDTQLKRAPLAAGDVWRHQCPDCTLITQGGAPGLTAHRQLVHGLEVAS